MSVNRPGRLMLAIERICSQRGWRHGLSASGDFMAVEYDGVPLALRPVENLEIVLLFIPIADSQRSPRPDVQRAVGEYLEEVNLRRTLVGHFVHSSRTGEIRYEATVPAAGGSLNADQLEQTMIVSVVTVRTFARTIDALLSGRMTLRQALVELDAEAA